MFLFGPKLAWVDLFLFNALDSFQDKLDPILESFPLLKKQNEAVRNIPNIAKYLKSRPERAFRNEILNDQVFKNYSRKCSNFGRMFKVFLTQIIMKHIFKNIQLKIKILKN